MYYNFKNIPITINGQEILINNASLNSTANLVSVYDVGNALNFSRAAVDGIQGSLSLSYYPTGLDLIKSCINYV